jgi:D-alanyl-D-alanine carboxypeptidase
MAKACHKGGVRRRKSALNPSPVLPKEGRAIQIGSSGWMNGQELDLDDRVKSSAKMPGTVGLCMRLAAIAVAVVVCASASTSSAQAASAKHAAFVIDANTGAVISASNADEPRYPASLTKMMTLYVVFDLIEQGKLSYQTRIKVSEEAAGAPPTKLGLKEGSEIALIDAIKALITKSANDMAIAIAEHVAGSEEKFANLMTQRARQIGMTASTFKNAHGLPNDAQVTTARDMVTLGLRLHDDFPKHFPLFSTREFRHGGEVHRNHNTMLNNYDGTDGIKTGYTRASGYNLVASVKRGSKHVVGAVFGGSSAGQRNQTMRTLLNIALVKSSPVKTRKPAVAMAALKPTREPQLAVRPAVAKVAPGDAVSPPTSKLALVELPKPVAAPPRAAKSSDEAPIAVAATSGIEMAKVRPVLVAPRAARQAPLPVPPLPERVAEPAFTTQVLSPVVATFAPPPQLSRGAGPSSLQAQAENLQRNGAPGTVPPVRQANAASPERPGPAFRLNGPAVVAATAVGVHVQIGAYSSEAEASRQLSAIRDKAGDLLKGSQPVTLTAEANGRKLYRARYAGFDAARAGTVCTELRRRQIDCLVAKAE